MATIRKGREPVTFINVFTVEPERIDALLEHQHRDVEAFIRHVPGLVSTSWHRSLDGTRVVNYAQWESLDAFRAATADPRFRRHNAEAEALSISHDGHFYEVPFTSSEP